MPPADARVCKLQPPFSHSLSPVRSARVSLFLSLPPSSLSPLPSSSSPLRLSVILASYTQSLFKHTLSYHHRHGTQLIIISPYLTLPSLSQSLPPELRQLRRRLRRRLWRRWPRPARWLGRLRRQNEQSRWRSSRHRLVCSQA